MLYPCDTICLIEVGNRGATIKVVQICMISGFRLKVDENCPLLGYYAASSGNSILTFQDNLLVRSSRVQEDGTDRLSQNISKELLQLAV